MGRKPITPNNGGQKSGPAEPGGPGPAGDECRTTPASSADPHSPGDPGSFEVGYGRPPLHSRFKPGQSGNPKGRAKQSRNMRTIVQQVLSENMQIREGGRLRRMSGDRGSRPHNPGTRLQGRSQSSGFADGHHEAERLWP